MENWKDPSSKQFELRRFREQVLDMTREELAVEIGVSMSTIGRWERGNFSINKSAKKNLARLLKG